MKKIRASILKTQYDALKEELKKFNISLYKLGNQLILGYQDQKLEIKPLEGGKTEVIQFNTNKNIDEERYLDILKKQNIQIEADYIRAIIAKYLDESIEKREYILFGDTIEKLKIAIEIEKKVEIKYQKNHIVINPYFLERDEVDGKTYLFSYSDLIQKFKTYKISDIKHVEVLKEDVEVKEREYIEKMRREKKSL